MSATPGIRVSQDAPSGSAPEISIVVPVFNEEDNVVELHRAAGRRIDRDGRDHLRR